MNPVRSSADRSATDTPALVCSAKGCRATARWELRWNNPRLHTPDRRKVWTACDDHREHLAGFLDLRGFLREVEEVRAGHPSGTAPAQPLPPAAGTA